jgi:hypothetical protein
MDKKLINFIAKAKKQAYASLTSKPKKTKDGGKIYSYREGDFCYTDTYFGNLIDSGQERIYFKGKVIWVMSYRGGIYNRYIHLKDRAFDFLKQCISRVPEEFPARGPKSRIIGRFKYENKWKGDIKGFVGEENVYFDNKKICFRNYVGGFIKNKE